MIVFTRNFKARNENDYLFQKVILNVRKRQFIDNVIFIAQDQ